MPRRKIEQIFEGQWTRWNRSDMWLCCDCLLRHDVEFRVVNGHVELKMKVNRRSTAAYRRGQGIKLICKPKDGTRNNPSRNDK